jgi:hypothetical protein
MPFDALTAGHAALCHGRDLAERITDLSLLSVLQPGHPAVALLSRSLGAECRLLALALDALAECLRVSGVESPPLTAASRVDQISALSDDVTALLTRSRRLLDRATEDTTTGGDCP